MRPACDFLLRELAAGRVRPIVRTRGSRYIVFMVKVSVKYAGDLHCDATHGPSQSKISTDAPTDNKGKGEAFSPTDLVATALATCMSTTMGIRAEELGVNLRGMTVSVQKETGSLDCRVKCTFRCRPIRPIAKSSSKPRSIVRCTRVCRQKSIGRRNFSGKEDRLPACLGRRASQPAESVAKPDRQRCLSAGSG